MDSRYTDPRYTDSGYTDSGYTDSMHTDSGYTDSMYTDSRYTDSRYTDSRYTDSRYTDSRYTGECEVTRQVQIHSTQTLGQIIFLNWFLVKINRQIKRSANMKYINIVKTLNLTKLLKEFRNHFGLTMLYLELL